MTPDPLPPTEQTGDQRPAGVPRAVGLPDLLVAGTLAWVDEQVVRHCGSRLQQADLDDACQAARLAVVQALMENYDSDRAAGPPEMALLTFLDRIVSRRIANFLRAYWRSARHHDHSLAAARLLEGGAGRRGGRRGPHRPLAFGGEDPAQLAERHEQVARAAAAVDSLGERDRLLCELVEAGASQEEMARRLGVSRGVVRRLLRELFAKLRAVPGLPPD